MDVDEFIFWEVELFAWLVGADGDEEILELWASERNFVILKELAKNFGGDVVVQVLKKLAGNCGRGRDKVFN